MGSAFEHDPAADPAAVIVSGDARFTVLSPRVVRMEWAPQGAFENRASLTFLNRRLPVPPFEVRRAHGRLEIRTDALTLRYIEDTGAFDRDNLAVEFTVRGESRVWTPGMTPTGNLGGTWRTLDDISGVSPLAPGLLSRDGWALVDDSHRPLLEDACGAGILPPWAVPRGVDGALDWTLFTSDGDYAQTLRDFTALAGAIPLPPRYVFGAWWSRYWPYTDRELVRLVGEFREHDVPIDVLVIDMDWHLDGWTGYTWNPRYFPLPERFLGWARSEGLRVTLNLHPHEGVGRHERAFEQMCDAVGIDPEESDLVPFEPADPAFMKAYFEVLLHPLERQGVDFWWIDWQQGDKTRIPGLDPLFWLNHLHWTDVRTNPARRPLRPLILSRWGGLGSHRYPIGFSGDTFSDWPSLAWQPCFTATAGNVGFAWWSHDIGGHQPGPVEPELYARWIQFGALSPVLRTHAGRHRQAERRIWAFDEQTFRVCREAWRLRYALLPYIYTMARKAHDESLPLVRPLYYEWPDHEAAYRHCGQYLFGDDLLVAPAVAPGNPASGTASVRVWLPPGRWRHWFTGRVYDGPREAYVATPLEHIPLFVRDGAAIPLAPPARNTHERPLDPLILEVFPAAETAVHVSRLYEDDGLTDGYLDGHCAWTPIRCETGPAACRVEIGPTEGTFDGQPAQRGYELRIRDVLPPAQVLVDGKPISGGLESAGGPAAGWSYDGDTLTLVVRVPPRDIRIATTVDVTLADDEESAALLRSGLREELAVLRDIRRQMGESTPGGIRLMTEIGRELEEAGAAPAVDISAGQNVVPEILACKLPDPTRRQALTRLFEVFAAIHADVAEDGAVHVRADLGCGKQPAWAYELDVRAALGLPPGVEVVEEPAGERDEAGRPVIAALAQFRPAAVPQTGWLRAELTVEVDAAEFTIPAARVIFPSIQGWWLAGPFEPRDAGRLNLAIASLDKVNPDETYDGKGGEIVGWRQVVREIAPGDDISSEFVVDLEKVFGEAPGGRIAYALTHLVAPREMSVRLALGSADGVVVWVNGREYHRNLVARPYASRQDVCTVPLREGVNTLVLRIEQQRGPWAFGVHVETPDGRPETEVEIRLTP